MGNYVLEGPKWPYGPITWSFARADEPVDQPFSSVVSAPYQAVVVQAIDDWSAASGLIFQQVDDSASTDIRIGFGLLDPANTGRIGQTYFGYDATGAMFTPGVEVLLEDPAQLPLVSSNGVLTYQTYTSTLYQIALHEFGHGLGLGHSTDPTAVMYYAATPTNAVLSGSDIAGIHAIYGSPSSPDFDPTYYLAHNPDVAASYVDPVAHFAASGWQEWRNPDAYFDVGYYLRQNPDVALAHIDPLQHYETYGWKEGRDPSHAFSTSAYLAANPDVAAAGLDPLSHYLHAGQLEGRPRFVATPHAIVTTDPLIDPTYYFNANPDVATAGLDPFIHYDTTGWREGLNPDAWFDTDYYLSHNADVAAAGINPMLHYETYGWHEGRDPGPLFSTDKYLAANPDVAAAQIDPLAHYLLYGAQEGRAAFHV